MFDMKPENNNTPHSREEFKDMSPDQLRQYLSKSLDTAQKDDDDTGESPRVSRPLVPIKTKKLAETLYSHKRNLFPTVCQTTTLKHHRH